MINEPTHPTRADLVDGIAAKVADILESEVRKHPVWLEFLRECPGWQIRFCDMEDDEQIRWDDRTISLALWRWPDPLRRAAHSVAHVRLMHRPHGEYTDEECDAADDLGQCWLAWA